MKQLLDRLDAPTRRQFVERCAAAAFGLNVIPATQLLADETNPAPHPAFGKAKSVIWIMLGGGLSHID
ncbi:MAG TPA: DUF1501 domain-containing protein, partial [Planctomycetaceae bacterium]|nr:DUF1501 domain-containing protein [Planctomycetaceae bacterium]